MADQTRRLKILRIPKDISFKHDIILYLSKLPADAELTHTAYDWNRRCYEFTFWSSEWDLLKMWEEPTEFTVTTATGELDEMRQLIETGAGPQQPKMASADEFLKQLQNSLAIPGVCNCDKDYAGLRNHHKDCAVNVKRS